MFLGGGKRPPPPIGWSAAHTGTYPICVVGMQWPCCGLLWAEGNGQVAGFDGQRAVGRFQAPTAVGSGLLRAAVSGYCVLFPCSEL